MCLVSPRCHLGVLYGGRASPVVWCVKCLLGVTWASYTAVDLVRWFGVFSVS